MVNNHCNGPIYDLAEVQRCAREGRILVVNMRAQTNISSLGWTASQLQSLICSLRHAHYDKSFNRQQTQAGVLSVDAYKICFDEDRLIEVKESQDGGLFYYIKLALCEDYIYPSEQASAVVSFHLT